MFSRSLLVFSFIFIGGVAKAKIMMMPGLVCAGASTTAAAVGYLPTHHCFASRASVGTYFDVNGVMQTAAADTPRSHYHPTTHAFLGILLEPSATNVIWPSSDVGNSSYWFRNGTPTLGTTTAPDGGTATTFLSSGTYSGSYRQAAAIANTVYTFSGYVKNISGGLQVMVGCDNLGSGTGAVDASMRFNPSTGAFISAAVGVTAYSITDVGNGWYRWTVTATSNTTSTSTVLLNYNATNTSTVAFWGNQRETGSVATSYIPTTTAAVTRAADISRAP